MDGERLGTNMRIRRVFIAGVLLLTLIVTVTMSSDLFGDGAKGKTLPVDTVPSSHTLYRITHQGQIIKSNDSGRSWTLVDGPRSRATALAVVNDQVLYVGTESAGVFKSRDGGLTWEHASAGLGPMPHVTVTALAVDQNDGANATARRGIDVVYAAIGYWFGTSEAHFAPMGVYVSHDAGASWESLSQGPTPGVVSRLALDPAAPNLLRAELSGGGVIVYRD